jgi:hypothetical protein
VPSDGARGRRVGGQAEAAGQGLCHALVTITVNPVGKGTARVFDPDAIVNGRRAVDVAWKEDQ